MRSISRILFLFTWVSVSFNFSECSIVPDGLFDDSDLMFIFTPECFTRLDVDADFPYFNYLRLKNSYTPLRHVGLCQTNSAFRLTYGTSWTPFEYRVNQKAARSKAIFFPTLSTGYFNAYGKLKCEYLLLVADRLLRQDYVFVQTRVSTCFKHFYKWLGSAKFVVYEESLTLPVSIPCLTCNPIILSKLESLTLPRIRLGMLKIVTCTKP